MLPKSYLVFKWTIYSLATLLLFALQYLVLNHIHAFGVTPFLYPMLPAVLASYEGQRRGSLFALGLGVVCDLLLVGPFEGIYAISFTLTALIAALIAENLLAPGLLCGLVVSSIGLLLTGFLRIAALMLSGSHYLSLMLQTLLGEVLFSLPALLVILPLYRVIHRHCASEY